ncbi:MAG TPA: hypothetical protein VFZ24_13665 [Longimicrobiales bacterium]
MRSFTDESGSPWVASAREEDTPRHHGRWYLVFEAPDGAVLPMPEVRWQTRSTAERTLLTMSIFELRRRLHIVLERALREHGASPSDGATTTSIRGRTSAGAG